MALGGFRGSEPILTVEQFAERVERESALLPCAAGQDRISRARGNPTTGQGTLSTREPGQQGHHHLGPVRGARSMKNQLDATTIS